jgi:hypothetical protein
MRVFADMVAHTTLLYLYNISKSLPSEGIEPVIMPDLERDALAAALEMVNLSRVLDELSIFKVTLSVGVSSIGLTETDSSSHTLPAPFGCRVLGSAKVSDGVF